MTPIAAKLAKIFISAKSMTIMPAVLKNIPDFELEPILNELKLMSASTGSVPRAKTSMVSAPSMKLPVESVKICIDWVNPHGRKNVAAPIRRGVSRWFHFEMPKARSEMNLGMAG